MFRILDKESLAEAIKLMVVEAPAIARKARAGQFVILRLHEKGERIPLTIADFDAKRGTLTIVFQEVGRTTTELGLMEEGEEIRDVIGPLGKPTELENCGTVVCVGGGVGIAPVYPIARAMREAGNRVVSIIGARSAGLLFFVDRMAAVSDELHITTDDGSRGRKGFVSAALQDMIAAGKEMGLVMAVGPVVMMRAVAEVTRPHGIRTVVSLNPIMVDGTGMCGACRVEVGGQTRFACVDGPEFDAHQVDFNLLIARQRIYLDKEKQALDAFRQRRGERGCQGCR